MHPSEEAIFELVPKRVDELLIELAQLRRRQATGEPVRVPIVTLHLRGLNVTGRVMKLAEDKRGAYNVLFQETGLDLRNPKYDVVHFSSNSIEAVTIHDAASLDAPPPSVQSGPKPTRLELKRRVAALEQQMSERIGASLTIEILWDTIPDTEDAALVMNDVVDQFELVLRDLVKEQLALEALRQKLRKVSIRASNQAFAKMEGPVLTLVTTGSWNNRLQREDLRTALERGL